jgi:hypothetical protein
MKIKHRLNFFEKKKKEQAWDRKSWDEEVPLALDLEKSEVAKAIWG